MGCCEGYCKKCHGMIWGLFGVLILINAFVWPRLIGIDGWMAFIGFLLILAGIWRSVMPECGCHNEAECCKTELNSSMKEVKKKK